MKIPDKGVVLVDLWAPWCGPCRMMSPILEALEKEMEITLVKINVDDEDATIRPYLEKHAITSIPCFHIYKDGILLDSVIGRVDKEFLKRRIQTLTQ